ncbi:hypothetical protein K8T06_02830, partial [bacterium]|nr:hypothetical protein [bacterium]
SNGGAIDVRQYGAFLLHNSFFYNNYAGGSGGAISTWLAQGRAHDCIFTGNQSNIGGAWSSRQDHGFILTGSQLVSNEAGMGGGLSLQQGQFDLIDCLVAENIVSPATEINGHGGGIYLNDAVTLLANCTVAGNESIGFSRITGGGITAVGNTDLTIIDSIIRTNSALTGTDLTIGLPWSSAYSSIAYSNLTVDDPLTVSTADGSELHIGEGLQDADPLFIWGDFNWQLSSLWSGQTEDSPCIDAGSDRAILMTYMTPYSIENLGLRSSETGGWPDQDNVDLGWHAPLSDCEHNGDINGDGSITWEDVQLVFQLAFEVLPYNYEDICVADLNFDAEITMTDVQMVAGKLGSGEAGKLEC